MSYMTYYLAYKYQRRTVRLTYGLWYGDLKIGKYKII